MKRDNETMRRKRNGPESVSNDRRFLFLIVLSIISYLYYSEEARRSGVRKEGGSEGTERVGGKTEEVLGWISRGYQTQLIKILFGFKVLSLRPGRSDIMLLIFMTHPTEYGIELAQGFKQGWYRTHTPLIV